MHHKKVVSIKVKVEGEVKPIGDQVLKEIEAVETVEAEAVQVVLANMKICPEAIEEVEDGTVQKGCRWICCVMMHKVWTAVMKMNAWMT